MSEQALDAKNEESAAEQSTQQTPESPAVSQQRFNQVYWKQKETERQNQALQQQIDELKSRPAAQPAPTRPTLEQFDYDEGQFAHAKSVYESELAQQLIDQKVQEKIDAEFQRRNNLSAEQAQRQKTETFLKRSQEYALKNPEYDQVTQEAVGVVINRAASDIIINDPKGPALHHYLLTNPLVLEEINQISDPAMVGVKVGQLMGGLGSVQTSNAPPPINPGEGGAVSTKSLYDPNISMEEFERIANTG